MTHDVIVIGAGVVGPAIASALARQGRDVVIIERNWSRPDRIVGELMQPSGVKALQELGLAKTINNIEAIYCTGYWIKYFDQTIQIEYLDKSEASVSNPFKPVSDCVFDDNDKLATDSTISADEWYNDSKVRGVSFHNGDFLMNLREVVKNEENVTCIDGTATKILRDEDDVVIGVKVKQNGETRDIFSKLVICCDGIYSNFRKELYKGQTPQVGSHFVGVDLEDCVFPAKYHGHVILGDHGPVLAYQTSPKDSRMLCAYRSSKPPSQSTNELFDYLKNEVLPALPEEMKPCFKKALKIKRFRVMPNQYLPAKKQGSEKGLIMLGDSLNMRHPLTGGGMTVGLNDTVLLAKLLHPKHVEDLADHDTIRKKLHTFHSQRKKSAAVINTLSVALYALFAADTTPLKILQKGCFRYFLKGGDCVSGPIGLLSGMLPFPMLLFNHFFSVAFYAIYWNFIDRGFVGFLLAFYEAFATFFTAVIVFVPFLWGEMLT